MSRPDGEPGSLATAAKEAVVSKIRVSGISMSLDGFGAGPGQDLNNPLGRRGMELHQWFFGTRTLRQATGQEGGLSGIDESYAARSMEGLGAWIMGRNMFGPVRGDWREPYWDGWWGEQPPYHTPVFVLTHHPRPPLEMKGGTVFHFVTEGINAALAKARQAAGDRDIRIGGGVATIRQYLAAGLIDEIHLVLAPVVLGQGEALLTGIDLPSLGFGVAECKQTETAMHIILSRDQNKTGGAVDAVIGRHRG